jgi:hypothetical protein
LGQSLGISLSASNVSSCSVNGGIYTNYAVQLSQTQQYPNYSSTGFLSVSPTTNTNYTFTCLGTNGQSVSASSIININGASGGTPTANIYANQTSISAGQPITITWNSTNATTCSLSGNGTNILSNQNSSGTYLVYPAVSTNYQISCSNVGSVAANSYVYVAVNSTTSSNSVISLLNNSNRYVTVQIIKNGNSCIGTGTISWGDGQTSQIPYSSSCGAVSVSHSYSYTGNMSINAVVDGGQSNTLQIYVQ